MECVRQGVPETKHRAEKRKKPRRREARAPPETAARPDSSRSKCERLLLGFASREREHGGRDARALEGERERTRARRNRQSQEPLRRAGQEGAHRPPRQVDERQQAKREEDRRPRRPRFEPGEDGVREKDDHRDPEEGRLAARPATLRAQRERREDDGRRREDERRAGKRDPPTNDQDEEQKGRRVSG